MPIKYQTRKRLWQHAAAVKPVYMRLDTDQGLRKVPSIWEDVVKCRYSSLCNVRPQKLEDFAFFKSRFLQFGALSSIKFREIRCPNANITGRYIQSMHTNGEKVNDINPCLPTPNGFSPSPQNANQCGLRVLGSCKFIFCAHFDI